MQSRTVTERNDLQRLVKSKESDVLRLEQLEEQLKRHQTESTSYQKQLQQHEERVASVSLHLARLNVRRRRNDLYNVQLTHAIEKATQEKRTAEVEMRKTTAQLEEFEHTQEKVTIQGLTHRDVTHRMVE